ncbi:serine/threonine-protein kinase [Streptomyces sp. NPDC060194]|uniref:serine/threonine-protein kinase n=1 Tax=Streptomyces sp. NPDC060194 TaxID=3347069 RepID=UPI0036699AD8
MQPLDAGEPTVIGPYRLLGRLGAGGMGRVYLGRSAGGRTVAVKLVHPHFATDGEFRARFRREVAAARRVGGAWTAPVIDADPEAAVPWVATGYVAGPPLDRAVADHGPLPPAGTRALGAGLAEALEHVHGLGLVHRDVKPSNVLLTLDGPRLIDFGISRATDGTHSLTATGVSVGSPGFMAPEQVLGKGVTTAADVFSLGAVLAYAATGRAPFPGDSSAALLYKVVHEEPELQGLRAVDPALHDLVARCLSKEPAARPTPAALAADLAPGGAAELIAAGWLPAALVAQVSRSAVALLDLDAGPEPSASPLSGPLPFSGPVATPSGGVFGPPDPSYGAGAGGVSAARDGSGAEVPPRPSGPPTPPPGEPMRPRGPGEPGYPGEGKRAADQGRGGIALSMTADNRRHETGGRRMSCTLALSLAAAVAAVALGGVFVLPMLGGDDEGGGDRAGAARSSSADSSPPDAAQPRPSGEASPSATASRPPATGSASVPKEFLGTWKGPFTIEVFGTRTQGGTFTVTIGEGRTGKRFATVDQYDALGNFTCQDALTLRSAPSEKELVTDARHTGKSGGAPCTTGTHGVTLKLSGEQLTMVSDDARAGRPEAELTRDGG